MIVNLYSSIIYPAVPFGKDNNGKHYYFSIHCIGWTVDDYPHPNDILNPLTSISLAYHFKNNPMFKLWYTTWRTNQVIDEILEQGAS